MSLQSASGIMSSFDRVATLAHSAFNSIAGSVPLLSGKKVMAALIIHAEDGTIDDEVIAIGTGGFKSIVLMYWLVFIVRDSVGFLK